MIPKCFVSFEFFWSSDPGSIKDVFENYRQLPLMKTKGEECAVL